MSELKSVSEPLEEKKIILPMRCPICGVETNYVYRIEDGKTGDKSDWYLCQCKVLFQDNPPDHNNYDEKYVASLAEAKQAKLRYEYMLKIYGHLIEELTYGRMVLEVGFCVPYLLKAFEERGWLTWGIDANPTLTGKGNLYNGDFMTYDFSLPVNEPDLAKEIGKTIDRKFDLIWMGHVLEHLSNPMAALSRAYDLLDPKGVLFIATPDIDFIFKEGVSGWPHFKKHEHYIMWSEHSLKRELERLGFNIIMCRRNFASRFMSWFDLHIIAQKNYF